MRCQIVTRSSLDANSNGFQNGLTAAERRKSALSVNEAVA